MRSLRCPPFTLCMCAPSSLMRQRHDRPCRRRGVVHPCEKKESESGEQDWAVPRQRGLLSSVIHPIDHANTSVTRQRIADANLHGSGWTCSCTHVYRSGACVPAFIRPSQRACCDAARIHGHPLK